MVKRDDIARRKKHVTDYSGAIVRGMEADTEYDTGMATYYAQNLIQQIDRLLLDCDDPETIEFVAEAEERVLKVAYKLKNNLVIAIFDGRPRDAER